LKNTRRLVDRYRTFRKVANNLLTGEFLKEHGIKELWRGEEYKKEKNVNGRMSTF